jgi:hypothetical protein
LARVGWGGNARFGFPLTFETWSLIRPVTDDLFVEADCEGRSCARCDEPGA